MKWISTKGRYQRKHRPLRNWIPILILLAASSVGALAAVRGILRDQNRQEEYDLISESVHAEESSTADYIPAIPVIPADTTREPVEIETEPEILTQYASVYEQNPDLFGWICIENTVLDYPVMHTPDDSEKYLRLSFEGETSTAGTPFMDAKCGIDSDNYIIYGHNMKNGTMFREILQYANKSYWQEHPMIKFNTLYEQGEYDVLAAFYDRVYYADENCFKFYRFIKAADKADYDNAIQNYKEKSLYDTGVTAEYGDKLITLVTCSYHEEHGRFVVVARQR